MKGFVFLLILAIIIFFLFLFLWIFTEIEKLNDKLNQIGELLKDITDKK